MPNEVKCHKCSIAPGVHRVPGDRGWLVCDKCWYLVNVALVGYYERLGGSRRPRTRREGVANAQR